MSKIFVSHSSKDNAHALALCKWLDELGWGDYFLDVRIEGESGIAPGERWKDALSRAVHRCRVVICLISTDALASGECRTEIRHAETLGKAVIGVLVDRLLTVASLPQDLLESWQICDLTISGPARTFNVELPKTIGHAIVDLPQEGLRQLREGLRRLGLNPENFPYKPERGPYQGLRPLEFDDAAVFFGRDADIVRGLDQIRGMIDHATSRILVVLAASGAGKSSFLRAGLWPRLKQDDQRLLVLPIMRPGQDAVNSEQGLVSCLSSAFHDLHSPRSPGRIKKELSQPAGLSAVLEDMASLAAKAHGNQAIPPTLLLGIDQAEELLVTEGSQTTSDFLGRLSAVVGDLEPRMTGARLLVVMAIRSDSYGQLQTKLADHVLVPTPFDLSPIPSLEYKSVIIQPALIHSKAIQPSSLSIDPQLVPALLADAQGADALPMLSFALERLFVEHGADQTLTKAHFDAMGGVAGSIELAIEHAFEEPGRYPPLPADHSQRLKILRETFIPRLARVDVQTLQARRVVADIDDFNSTEADFLERLVTCRLLVKGLGSESTCTVEVAHEALLRQWPVLVEWLRQDQEALLLLDEIRDAAKRWSPASKSKAVANDEMLVHAGDRLAAATQACDRADFRPSVSVIEMDYLEACSRKEKALAQERLQAQQERGKAEKAQLRVRLQWRLLGLALLALGGAILGTMLVWQARQIFVLAVKSQRAGVGQLRDATAHALAATIADSQDPSGRGAAIMALEGAHPLLRYTLNSGHGAVRSIATHFRSTSMLASAHDDGSVVLWQGMDMKSVRAHENSARTVLFTNLGRSLVTGGDDGRLVWTDISDAGSLTLGKALPLGGSIAALASHPSEQLLAVGINRGTKAQVQWVASDSATPGDSFDVCDQSQVTALGFSPDGQQLAVGCWDHRVLIYDKDSKAKWHFTTTLAQPMAYNPVWQVQFRQDGKELAVAFDACGIALYAVDGDHRIDRSAQILDHPRSPRAFALAYVDRNRLVSANSKREVVQWDLLTEAPTRRNLCDRPSNNDPHPDRTSNPPQLGHSRNVVALAVSADSATVYSGDEDGSIFVWHAKPLNALSAYDRDAWGVAFSPDNRVLAIGTRTGVEFLDVITGKPSLDRKYSRLNVGSTVRRLAFSETGNILAVGTDGAYAQLWRLDGMGGSPVMLPDKQREKQYTWALAFSRHDRVEQVVTGSYSDKTPELRLRSVTDGTDVGLLIKGRSRMLDLAVKGDLALEGGADGGVRLWNLRTRAAECASVVGSHDGAPVLAVAFGIGKAQGLMASAGEDGSVRLWRGCGQSAVHIWRSNHGKALSVQFSAAGDAVVAGTHDGNVVFWDVTTGQPLADIAAHPGASVNGMTVSPDRKWIATAATTDGAQSTGSAERMPTVRLWSADTQADALRQRACNLLGRKVADSEEKLLTADRKAWERWIPGALAYRDFCN